MLLWMADEEEEVFFGFVVVVVFVVWFVAVGAILFAGILSGSSVCTVQDYCTCATIQYQVWYRQPGRLLLLWHTSYRS